MGKEPSAPAPFSVDHLPKENWGQKPFEPTDKDRELVRTLAGYGLVQKQICSMIINPSTGKPIDEKTLRAHFRDEYDEGAAKGDAAVLQSLFQQAVGRPAEIDDKGRVVRDELKPNVSAAIFASKARPGIKYTERVEHTGKDGGPMEHNHHGLDLSKYTDQELDQLESLLAKGGAASVPITGGNPAGTSKTQH
jgi:hypothetical protein